MRITGNRVLELAAQATARAQSDVAERSSELSSGVRVARPSDDPLAWAQARRAAVRQATTHGRGDGLQVGRDHLADTERALAALGDVFAESRTLAMQAVNANYSAADRAAIGEQVAGQFAVALDAANARNAAGEYVFGGSQSTTLPFDAAGVYHGDATTRSIELDDVSQGTATMAGSSLTAAEGIDVLPALARLRAALAANDTVGIEAAVSELDTAHAQVVRLREHVGGMQRAIEDADGARGQLEDTLTARIAGLVEVDMVEGATALAKSANALGAAQAVSSKLAALLAPR